MSKQDEYRFNLRFDETDEDHRKVCHFLNACCGSRKKARYIVKAILAYWAIENKAVEVPAIASASNTDIVKKNPSPTEKKNTEDQHFVNVDDDYETDEAEISLMMKNYSMFDNMDEGR